MPAPHGPISLDVARARRGDRAAARRLYDAHVDAVFGYCLAFTRRDRSTAAELCQESFTRAFGALSDLREDDRFSGWLMTTTRRTCLQWASKLRNERRALARLSTEPRLPATDRERSRRVVADVVAACPDDSLRDAAALFYTEPGRSTEQIAAELGISRTSVTTRLYRFRAWARQRMLARLAEALEAQ